VLLTNCAFSLTTVSLWYEQQFGEKMPEWGYGLYLKVYWVSGREIAKAVRRVERDKELFSCQELRVVVALGLLGIKEREVKTKDSDCSK
jgi:hypothetical protein